MTELLYELSKVMERGLLTVCLSDTHRSAPCTTSALLLCPHHTDRVKLCSWLACVNCSELGMTFTCTTPDGKLTVGEYTAGASPTFFTVRLTTTGPAVEFHVSARVDTVEKADVVGGGDVVDQAR